MTINSQLIVIDSIQATDNFKPSIDGKQWYLGYLGIWVVLRDKLTMVHYQFMAIDGICQVYEFPLSVDGER